MKQVNVGEQGYLCSVECIAMYVVKTMRVLFAGLTIDNKILVCKVGCFRLSPDYYCIGGGTDSEIRQEAVLRATPSLNAGHVL